MKNSYKAIASRREKILDVLNHVDSMTISELSDRLGVSEMTIRRDCNNLSQMGRITQKRGIVKFVSQETANHSESREKIKKGLGHEAAFHIHDGEIVFTNSSTTSMYAIAALIKKPVTIITNNGNAARYISDNDPARLILSGGNVNEHDIMSGDIANQTFLSMRADWSIIGCAGISLEQGISTPRIEEANVNRNIIKNSRRVIVVADYSKFGSFSNFTIGKVSDIDILITDPFVSGKTLDAFRKQGVKVIQVANF
ncbi:DeoR/GlpR family DNA-binding transcription regulator [Limosilactobacillus caecicola]|uniref:DeoR/GlpR family DNA-binding transcription regulator n=1 Tax=Limosilactobacillus caecicola TaxID=2941332 RepID=UPI00203AE51F|nr:DeoR/GlpR family DNA-binding transcription regulator [Limosilactobacillus caecicola]